jgi:hypothetical protein
MRDVRTIRFAAMSAALASSATIVSAVRTAEAQTSTAAPSSGSASGVLTAIVLIAALLVLIIAAVKIFDLRRRRESEAVQLQAQISEALLREPGLFGLPVTATARVPLWTGTPAAIELSGQVPAPEQREAVLKIAREEAARIRPDYTIEDRLAVVPTMAVPAA